MQNKTSAVRFVFILVLLNFFVVETFSQNASTKKNYGKFNGGVESNMGVYIKDSKFKENDDADKFGINTYVNLGYRIKDFSFGTQYEIFEPPMRGFYKQLKGNKLVQYFGAYETNSANITLGSFYEQFGSGLIFRSYEERGLGINTSMRGMDIQCTPFSGLYLKAMCGQPRLYLKYADAVYGGVDISYAIPNIWNSDGRYSMYLGGSWVTRRTTKTVKFSREPEMLNLYSLRTSLNFPNINLAMEYTGKGKSPMIVGESEPFNKKGSAFLLNIDYNRRGFGFSGVFRRLEYMNLRIDNNIDRVTMSMNYIPALTKQHKYTLASIYPYRSNTGEEIGGQMDVFTELRCGFLGKYPLKLSMNGSYYRSLGHTETKETASFFGNDGREFFHEIGFEAEKKINKDFKTVFAFYAQRIWGMAMNGHEDKMLSSYIYILDALWKINHKNSLRMEVQHMNTDNPDKLWIYGLAEYGFVPHFMFSVSDMYNYGANKNKIHYYNVGGCYTYRSFRAALSYGRNRGGLLCIGGICREVPNYSGFTINLSYCF